MDAEESTPKREASSDLTNCYEAGKLLLIIKRQSWMDAARIDLVLGSKGLNVYSL
jgi:hypothetical protein